jgi:hypothetical protein
MRYFDDLSNCGAVAEVVTVKLHDDDDSVVRANTCESGIREHFVYKPCRPIDLYIVLASAVALVVFGWIFAKYCPDVRINYETMECEAVFNVRMFVTFLLAALAEVGGYAYYCYYELTHM